MTEKCDHWTLIRELSGCIRLEKLLLVFASISDLLVEHLAKNFSPAFRLQRFAGLFVVVHVVLSFHATGRLSSFFRLRPA